MKTWHYYRLSDGVFDGRTLSASNDDETPRASQGYGLRADVDDWISQRVDLDSNELVDYARPIPPAPEPISDYEFDPAAFRWIRKPEAQDRQDRVDSARREIMRLEKRMLRAMREVILNPGDIVARKRIAEIDATIAEQRAIVRGEPAPAPSTAPGAKK